MQRVNTAYVGLKMDPIPSQRKPGELSFALNAVVEGFDGNSITYQNEQGNVLCTEFPEGYRVIGAKNIINLKKVVYMLVGENGSSQIGYSTHDNCEFVSLIDDTNSEQKLNFNGNYPIHKIIVKTTNCFHQIYWTDGLNPRRFLDLENLPWKESIDPTNPFNRIPIVGQLDTNKMLIQPNFSIPSITNLKEEVGGRLTMGTYQFAVQYANSLGEDYTSFYNVSNPFPIFENKITPDFNLPTSKAISLTVQGLDVSGLYDYFNLVVIKTINNIATPYLVGTFPIANREFNYTYTGANEQEIQLTIADIFEKYPYYDIAQDIFEIDNILGWDNLKAEEDASFQDIWSKVRVNWVTYKIPYTKFEGYNTGKNSADYRGYMRDEVYPLEGVFILANGKQTKKCHIPGRPARPEELDVVQTSNRDAVGSEVPCEDETVKRRWQVYNTALNKGKHPDYLARTVDDDCYVGPYEYGDMAYWESEEQYPSNTNIWGNLVGQKIRHHKFPDSLVTHIHDNNTNGQPTFEHSIFPIGIEINSSSLYEALSQSNLPQNVKDQIVGFKIIRGNRTTQKSIVAKGLLSNVGKYFYDSQEYYYPNYPYNDLRADPFFAKSKKKDHSGYNPDDSLDGFALSESKNRFIFHSPDTHFYQPSIGSGEHLKLETIEYGESYGHYVKVKENAEYKFLTKEALYAAAGIGVSSGFVIGAGTFGWPEYSLEPVIPNFVAASQLFEKLAPWTNFGLTYHSYGLYNKAFPIPNAGNKIRKIDFDKYLIDGFNSVEEGKVINNRRRESSIYIKTNEPLLFPHEYHPSIPEDTSRFTLSSSGFTSGLLDDFFALFLTNFTEDVQDSDISFALTTTPSADDDRVYYRFNFNIIDNTQTEAQIRDQLPLPGDTYTSNGSTYTVTDAGVDETTLGEFSAYIITEKTSGTTQPNSSLTLLNSANLAAFSSINYDSYDETYSPTVVDDTLNQQIPLVREQLLLIDSPETLEDFGDLDPILSTENYLRVVAYNAFYHRFGYYVADNTPSVVNQNIYKNPISSYYGSIKRTIPNQWGRMYSYESIDTGYYQRLYNEDGTRLLKFSHVFGGDIFINRFALKTKTPIYADNTVKRDNGADVAYDELGNYGYPMFWLSTKPVRFDVDITKETAAVIRKVQRVTVGDAIKGIFSGGGASVKPAIDLIMKIFKEIYEKIGIRNVNLDADITIGITEQGVHYLFVYGIPYFFVESEVNVDMRQADNDREGNFYPNVGEGIPDDWLQEITVPIIHDNKYTYNQTYSKQNKENFYTALREDYDPNKKCYTEFPNRAIWSDKSSVEETKNNWLVYRAAAKEDLTKSFGDLISVDGIENRQLLVRFTNKTQIYNALTTVKTSQGPDAYLGNSQLFSGSVPLDLSHTDSGHAGSQHKLLLKTEFGNIFIDAIRGQIILSRGASMKDLANDGWRRWMAENLPFHIAESFPTFPVDNHFAGVGLHGVYDPLYKRILLTKLDYEPLVPMTFLGDNKFKVNGETVQVGDSRYFCNKSWTLSYNFLIEQFVSFHSYLPNFYVPFPTYFQTGIGEQAFNHNITKTIYNNFYGQIEPYILEYPFVFDKEDEQIQSISDFTKANKFMDEVRSVQMDDVYFNKAWIYNDQQSTGILELVMKPRQNLAAYATYPKYKEFSKEILYTKRNNIYNYNTIYDIVRTEDSPIFKESCTIIDKDFDTDNLDYAKRSFMKSPIRAKDAKVRHILDNRDDVRLTSQFILLQTQKQP